MNRLLLLAFLLTTLAGCATNPVTGENNLIIYSENWDRDVGAQQYGPAQQSQGGEYIADPSLSRYVNDVGRRVAEWSDNGLLNYEFVVLNNGVPNAWALPGGKIAVNRGLLMELNNEAELAAVLGHEVVHAAARHGAQAASRGALLQGALTVGAIASQDSRYADVIVGGAALGAQLINTRYGRDAERESDHYGIRYMIAAGYDPRAAISLQETFVRLSEGRNQSWLNGLFASHPPSEERVANNRALVQQLAPEYDYDALELGRASYQEATAHIREMAPAYELYEEALAAVNDDNYPQALSLLDRAIAIEPQESHFYGLRGDVNVYQGNYNEAIRAYDQAISRYGNYFDYHVGRGVAYSRLGNRASARDDLEYSMQLLPTSIAANELGKLSYAGNDFAEAKQYFQMAASGQGGASEEARQYYARLDVQDNPNNYLQTSVAANSGGELLVTVRNPLDVSLRNVQVAVQVRVDGISTQVSRSLPFLNAGSSQTVNTGMRLPENFDRETDQVVSGIVSVEAERL